MRGQGSASALWTRDFWSISLASFFVFTSFQILIPVLPKYIEGFGARESVIGLMVGFFSVSALLVRPFAGRELDRRNRKTIYLGGLVFLLAVVLSYRLATSTAGVLAIRFVHGFAWGVVSTAAGTIVTDVVPPERRGEGIGYYGMFLNLAMSVAPATGLYLLHRYGFAPVFYTSGVLVTAALLLATRLGDRTGAVRDQNSAPALFEPRAALPSLVALLTSSGFASIVTFLQLYADWRGLGSAGLFFTVYALVLLSTRPFAGRLYDRAGPHWVIIPGLCLVSLGLVLVSFSQTLGLLLLAAVVYGFGLGAANPALQALTVGYVPPARRGAANATYFAAMDIGIGGGALLLGLVAQLAGFEVMYRVTAGMVGLALVVYLLVAGALPVAAGREREHLSH